ncbi:MAG: SDR family NAD(P)-dependent oxidoreductase [Bacteroidales bacterium]|nr:SDR family NAD(P)-dependent oxidoreductase [Bacteroidales bacterium]
MNQVILLTGGSSGIGAATAILLAQEGNHVYAGSRSGRLPEGLNPESLAACRGFVRAMALDVNDASSLQSAVENICREEGRLDVLVCNAGNGIAGAIEQTNEEEAKYQFETCFFGAVKSIQACLPTFRAQGHGKIITVTSVAAVIPLPYQAFYSAVKAALLSLTQSLQLEMKPFHIQCCSILPGDTKTGFTAARKYTKAAQDSSSPYYKAMMASVQKMEKDEQNGMSAQVIARAIARQVRRRRMSISVTPRIDYWAIGLLVRLLPRRLVLWIVGLLY